MTSTPSTSTVSAPLQHWLKTYYFGRAGFSVLWVLAAFTVGKAIPAAGIALLVAYPAWDGLANWIDARRAGGLRRNASQTLNVVVSIITTVAVVVAFTAHPFPPLAVFGVWAALAGLFQLVTGIRRWKSGGQWAMVLSGAQSVLAGLHMLQRAPTAPTVDPTGIALYAAFGAFYFLVSALWLTWKTRRA